MTTVIDILANGGLMSKFFDNYEQRPQQIQMAKYVDKAIEDGETLLVQAATGTGKSLAYLIPAILSGKKFVVSTATKALQHQLLDKDIPLLEEVFRGLGKPFKARLFKGRSNYISRRRFKEYLSETNKPGELRSFDSTMAQWEGTTFDGDFEELKFKLPHDYKKEVRSDTDDCQGRGCPLYSSCFYYKAKGKIQEADIIIVNHDLLAVDIVMKNNGAPGILPSYDGIILDEAHRFEDTVGKYLGFKINKFSFSNLTAMVTRVIKEEKSYFTENADDKEYLKQVTSQIFQSASEFFGGFVPADNKNSRLRLKPKSITEYIKTKYSGLLSQLDVLDSFLQRLPGSTEEAATALDGATQRIMHLKQRLDTVIRLSEYYDTFVFWLEIDKNVSIHCAPIDVSPYLKKWLFDRPPLEEIQAMEKMDNETYLKTVIMTSATMATNRSFSFMKQRMGIDHALELICSDVFNYKEQSLIYVPPNAVEGTSKQFSEVMAGNVLQVLQASQGRAFVLFTSYYELKRVLEMVRNYIPYTVLVQGDMPKGQLVERFRQDKHSVLFATSSFWEGVDIRGEELSCVIIDKIPFPQVGDPVVEAKVDYLKRQGKDWFNDFYVPHGIISLVQGFGRLIRSMDDSGVVAIMDNRLIIKNYGAKFIRSLPEVYRTQDINMVAQFYAYQDAKRQGRLG
ncbi:ATP-dependent helicase [Bacillus phage SP-15]|uniref:DNA 5'-3' helicase n=1 Tax=Bacillus phage SP-15 TaxID=1792032 RepID=A0A127AW80_9CAUD|nr:DNA helicase [Bacillus phage SP-15]AMM44956.1 ATP-dependent helicase [Bacillus phage SP-15]